MARLCPSTDSGLSSPFPYIKNKTLIFLQIKVRIFKEREVFI